MKSKKNKQISINKIISTSSSSSSSSSSLSSGNNPNIAKNKTKMKTIEMKYISKWNIESTIEWLKQIGYEDCGKHFREHRINGRALLMLSEDDLKEIIKHNVGQRKNLYHLIRLLQIKYNRFVNKMNSSFFSNNDDDDDEDNENNYEEEEKEIDNIEEQEFENLKEIKNNQHQSSQYSRKNNNKNVISYESKQENKQNNSIHSHFINEDDSDQLVQSNLTSGIKLSQSSNYLKNKNSDELINSIEVNFCENCLKKFDHSPYSNYSTSNGSNSPIRNYKGEKRKTLVSMAYLFLTCLWTSFMLTVVHDRVPDMQKYPPLPDIILDNVPLMPWAFFATEIIGLVLGFIMFVVLIFHKYRIIIFRRVCSLAGTIFLIRSITMLITSLSVPGIHIQCSSQKYGSLMNKLNGAWTILSGVGLYVNSVRTCGDYMFSGHTVWLTLLTHFITEYTPNSVPFLHTATWILNIFGLFFILGAHEHYSIDVFVAFYITSRLFLYYHSLSNNKVLFQRDHKRVKIWFPMLSYFESNIHSIVPNQYEFPPNFILYFYKLIKSKVKLTKRFITYKIQRKLE